MKAIAGPRVLAMLAACCCTIARAGAPFQTDDPEPVDLHADRGGPRQVAGRRPGEKLEEDVRRKRSDGAPHEMRRCADRKPDPARAIVG